MKKVEKLISACLAALILVLNISVAAAADDPVIDVDRHGSIALYISDLETGEPITSGDFVVYRVASIDDNNGRYEFVLVNEFANENLDLTNTESARFANSAAEYVIVRDPACYASARLNNGVLKFDDLPVGLYLVMNTVAAEGYYPLNPFVFSIPDIVDGVAVYDVIAEPKPEPLKPQGWVPPPTLPPPPITTTTISEPPPPPPTEPGPPPDTPIVPPEEGGDNDYDEDFDKNKGKNPPETGDDETPIFWFVGLVLSASAAVAAIVLYKNQKD